MSAATAPLLPRRALPLALGALVLMALVATSWLVSAAASAADPRAAHIQLVASAHGRWSLAADGTVTALGGSTELGAMPGGVTAAADPTGHGYWTASSAGTVRTAGSAAFHGDLRSFVLNQPIVGMASTPSGNGYWLTAADGGIFAFGDAGFHGSTGNLTLNSPVVAMASTPTGDGYWLAAADGGIFAFGGAAYHGALAGQWSERVTDIAATPHGYALLDAGGRIAEFSDRRAGHHGDDWTSPTTSPGSAVAGAVFRKMNAERTARGFAPLMWDPRLETSATAWSQTMSISGFRHDDVNALMRGLGGYDQLAENIFRGSGVYADAGSAHLGFMGSPEHRHTLLATTYTTAGVGVVCDATGQVWVTVHFGTPSGQAAGGSRPPTSPAPLIEDGQGGPACASNG